MWVSFLVAQLYLLARIVLKLQFIALRRRRCSRRVSPTPRMQPPGAQWPDSPAVEAVAGVSSTTLR